MTDSIRQPDQGSKELPPSAAHDARSTLARKGGGEEVLDANLRESEERLRLFTEHAPAALAMFDREMRYLVVSRRWMADYGLSGRDIIGRSHYDVFPEVPERWKSVHQRSLAGEIVRAEADLFERTDGSVQWLRWEVRPWHAADHTVGGIVIFSEDITERKQAEEALRRSEEKARVVLDSLSEGVAFLDPNGEVVELNSAGRAIMGVVAPELREASADIRSILVRGDGSPFPVAEQPGIVAVRTGHTVRNGEVGYRRSDGSMTWLLVHAQPVRDPSGHIVGAVSSFFDITERKQAVDEFRRVHNQLQSILDAVDEGIYGVDLDGKTTFINPAARRLLGYTHDEIIGRQVHQLIHHSRVDGTPYPREDCPIYAAFVDGKSHRVTDEVFWRKGGARLPVEYMSTPIRDQNGNLAGAVVAFNDISERQKLEAQLRQAQKMEAVGRLASGVAHDFNNLLTVILGETELGLAELPGDHPLRENLEGVRMAAHRAAGLTRQLLTFSRHEIVEHTLVNVNEVVSETDKMLLRLIGEDIERVVKLAPDLGTVRIDRGQLEQVLMNLVVNARDAMPEGGKLTIETLSASLDEDYARQHVDVRPGDYVLLVVSDSGVGMSTDVQAHLFEPFFTTKEHGKGTGLGLATCYGIVKQAGGHIGVYSEVGQGTAMNVYLPLVHAAAQPRHHTAQPRPRPGSETILLVEDETKVRKVAARMLETLGYRVVSAGDGEEALRLLEEQGASVDLLLTDVVLPGMGGRDLAERARQRHPGLRVLYASGYTADVALRHRILEQRDVLLRKPFTVESLAQKVRDVLDAERS